MTEPPDGEGDSSGPGEGVGLAVPVFRLVDGFVMRPASEAAQQLRRSRPELHRRLVDEHGRLRRSLHRHAQLARRYGRVFAACLPMGGGVRTVVLFHPPPVALVVLPDADPGCDPRPLLWDIGLTPREADLALLLARGADLATASRRLGISEGTARNHLKRAFAKTGCRGQTRLVALVARLELLAGALGAVAENGEEETPLS